MMTSVLKDILDYDPETGSFTWRVTRGSRAAAGSQAGTLRRDGYLQIGVCGEFYLAHRLAFLFMTGSWPVEFIDHENMVRSDNRWSNLRDATKSQNHANTRAYKNNKIGVKGVCQPAGSNSFIAQIKIDGRNRYLGSFPSSAEAKAVYDKHALEVYGDFARSQ